MKKNQFEKLPENFEKFLNKLSDDIGKLKLKNLELQNILPIFEEFIQSKKTEFLCSNDQFN